MIAELIGVLIYVAAPTLIAAFNGDPEVVHYGVMQARTIALFYFCWRFLTVSQQSFAAPVMQQFL